jgi:hypothetical protein
MGLSLALLGFSGPWGLYPTEVSPPNFLLNPQHPFLSSGSCPDGPLTPGKKAPPFRVEGWLNGLPPVLNSPASTLTVIVLWSHW